MFTLEQISAAHGRTKTGADFPRYVADLRALGLARYTYHVVDGHTEYAAPGGEGLSGPARYAALTIAGTFDPTFADRLRLHQAGGTTFPQFCDDCARTGVDRWVVDVEALTCTYFSAPGTTVLVETIPEYRG